MLDAEGWDVREAVEGSAQQEGDLPGLDHLWFVEYQSNPEENTDHLVVLSAHPRERGSAKERSALAGPASTSSTEVLGHEAIMVETELGDGSPAGAWAFWEQSESVVLQFGSSELNSEQLEELLTSLREVDDETWRRVTGAVVSPES